MLTEAQQRALEVGLRRLETDLAWMEELLGWIYEGVLVSFVEDLGDAQRQELRGGIDEARELIRGLRDTLGLRPDLISKSSWIVGHLAHLWVIAEECQSRYLRAYGPVGPDLPARTDPLARRLADLLLTMQRLAQEGPVRMPVGGDPAQP